MSAAPKRKPADSDAEFDEALNRIDSALDKLVKKVHDAKRAGDTPTKAFSPENIKRTRQEIAVLSAELLDESKQAVMRIQVDNAERERKTGRHHKPSAAQPKAAVPTRLIFRPS